MSLGERMDRCEQDLRSHLEPGELVLAIGRCEDITERGNLESAGAGWTFVMVTDRMVRWVPHADPRFEASLDLDTVTAATERLFAHRYGIALDHTSITRPSRVPARRFLTFEWGDAIEEKRSVRTELGFSRRDARAARSLREQLVARGVPFSERAPQRSVRPDPGTKLLRRTD